jgi:dGTPase
VSAAVTFAKLPAACAVGDDDEEPLTAREHPEPPHAYRAPFQRDRARVIHSRAFRRLAGKTQVFTQGASDHYRSRLTHTMEVAQLSRTIAAALGLNQDLTESLALVHDIGHPPFGHAGERALDEAMRGHGLRFDHNLHALRIVTFFEQRYAGFLGLNLTLGVREGIIKHSRDYSADEYPQLSAYLLDERPPLEAQLIDMADEIAYLTADFDDGIESGLLDFEHARKHVELVDQAHRRATLAHGGAPATETESGASAALASSSLTASAMTASAMSGRMINESLKRMLDALTSDLILETGQRVQAGGFTSLTAIRRAPERLARFSPAMEQMRREAKAYLSAHLYNSEEVAQHHQEAATVISALFACWTADPSLLPASCAASLAEEGVARTVADYLAGMTDSFIRAQYEQYRRHC